MNDITQINSAAAQTNLADQIARARTDYPFLWNQVIHNWQAADCDAAWLTYAANYLLLTGGVRWALDPFSLFTRLGGGQQPDFVADLSSLQLIVLSHAHNDHFDPNLISAVSSLPITWVIPEFMLEEVSEIANLPPERIIIPRPGIPVQVDGLVLHPFEALHFRQGNGVPEMGYLAEFNHKRWLFPGDTRSYDSDRIPHFLQLDGVFAHLWLGKACALQKQPPQAEDFCKFFISLDPARIVITHLKEMGRSIEELWDMNHFQFIQQEFCNHSPQIQVTAALMGEKVLL